MSARPLIGIDLGTTNSLVAVFENGAPRLIANAHGDFLTPSVVGILESGEAVVGKAARSLALTHPDRTVATFKRWMGEDRKVELAGREFTPPELSSLVLRALREDAEAELGTPITRVVVTVPAYFNQNQREATRQAGELAGLEVERIVNEPTAAALTYGFHERQADQKLLVLDLGGGTFDVTVMEIFEGTLEILSTAGESHLGGEDFTTSLVSHALKELGRELEYMEFKEPLMVARLREEAELAKQAIGVQDSGELRVPDSKGDVESTAQRISISAAQFDELVAPLMERMRAPTLRALRDAELAPNAIDEVLLIGGATRMPVVRLMASELFGRPPRDAVDPDHAVALGASVQAALVADDKAVDDLVMTDVCPHTLGVEIVKEFGSRSVDGYFMPVLHRNTTIPVSREESVHTIADGQTELHIKVYQGEGRRVEENLYLGDLDVKGLPREKRGLEVCIRFTYDLNGLLEVEAFVPLSKQKFVTVLKSKTKNLSKAEVEASLKRMQALKYYPREDLENQRLLTFANAALKEIDRFHRAELESCIDQYEQGLHLNERELFDHVREQLVMKLSSLDIPYVQGEDVE